MPLIVILLSTCSVVHTELPLSLPARCSYFTFLLGGRHLFGPSVSAGRHEQETNYLVAGSKSQREVGDTTT